MSDRFFHPPPWTDCMQLAESEAHHFSRVLRGQVGETVELFDGQGRSARGVVTELRKSLVRVRIEEISAPEPPPQPQILLAVASPKGERMRWMVEKLTELGVDRLIPLITARSVVEPGDQKLAKMQLVVVAACKQSRRNRLLQIDDPCPLPQLADRIEREQFQLLVGDPAGKPLMQLLTGTSPHPDRPRAILAVVGPEGGFTAEEMSQLSGWGAAACRLTEPLLRIETAAVCFAAQLTGWRLAES